VLTSLPLPRARQWQVIETTPWKCVEPASRSEGEQTRPGASKVEAAFFCPARQICARCEGAVLFDSAALIGAGAPRLSTILRLYRTDDKGGRIGSMCCTGSFMWVGSQLVYDSGDLRSRTNAVDVPLCVCQCPRTLQAVLQSHNDWEKRPGGPEGAKCTSNMAEPLTTGSTLAHGLVSDASAAVLSHKRYHTVLLLVRFGHFSDIGPLPAPQRGALGPSYCIVSTRAALGQRVSDHLCSNSLLGTGRGHGVNRPAPPTTTYSSIYGESRRRSRISPPGEKLPRVKASRCQSGANYKHVVKLKRVAMQPW
jgi:hypothetical protein